MSNIVEIVLKMKDLLSGGMQQAAAISQQASSTMATGTAAQTAAITNQARAVANLTKEYKVLSMAPKGSTMILAQAPLTKYGRDFTAVRDSIQGTIQGVHDTVGKGMTSAGNAVGGFTGRIWNMAKTTATTTGSMVKELFTHRSAIRHVGAAVGSLIGTTSILDAIQKTTGISTDVLAIAQEGLNIVMSMNPIGFVVGAIVALVVWIKTLCDHNKYWAQSLKDLWGVIKSWAHLQFTVWKAVGETIWYWIQFAWFKVESFVEYVVEAMSRVGKSLKLAMSGDWEGAKAVFATEIITKGGQQAEALKIAHAGRQDKYATDIVKDTVDMVKGMASMVSNVKTGWAKRNEAGTDPTKEAAKAKETSVMGKGKLGRTAMGSDKSNEITSGGGKNLVINIHELGNNMVLHTTNLKESAEEIGKVIRAEIIRVASSGASAAFGN